MLWVRSDNLVHEAGSRGAWEAVVPMAEYLQLKNELDDLRERHMRCVSPSSQEKTRREARTDG
jgi:hypothetical protein